MKVEMTQRDDRELGLGTAGPDGVAPSVAALKLEPGAEATQVADAVAARWQEIAAVLRPIIGQGGVSALYKRSVHLICSAHPWLAGTNEGFQIPVDVGALKAAVAQQDVSSAEAGGKAFLEAFEGLLASLIGPSLAGQLLRSARARPSPSSLLKEDES